LDRELAVTGVRGVAQTRGLVMPASGLGKLKMVAQVVAILALMLASDLSGEPGRWLHLLGLGAMWVVLGLALWSAVEYYQTFAAVISGRTSTPSEAFIDPDAAGGPVLELAGTARASAGSALAGSASPGSGPAGPASVASLSTASLSTTSRSPAPVSATPSSSTPVSSVPLAPSPRRS